MRESGLGSVWQEHAVTWDGRLERASSDFLSPISFFLFGLPRNGAGWKLSAFVFKG